jgi:phosphogluconate dehydratase
MARAVGLRLNWEDMARLSEVTPLLARIYPNGSADVNHFHAAGGVAFVLRELIDGGLLHPDVRTVWGEGLGDYALEPKLLGGSLRWIDPPAASADESVLRPLSRPFSDSGGLRLLKGNLGQGVIKTSAVAPEHWRVEAPARVFDSQEALGAAFAAKELDRDMIAVVRFQGPAANGMPELHRLTPILASLQDRGHKVALVTDGRMSGASGKVPAAIHVSPAADRNGPLARVRDGDSILLDARNGLLQVALDEAEFAARPAAPFVPRGEHGLGRELFAAFRRTVGPADEGASVLF